MTRIQAKLFVGCLAMIAFCLVAMPVLLSAAESSYDLVLRNARIVDGTGSPWYRGDMAIRGDGIARIAPSITEPATRVIDLGVTSGTNLA